jgi:hypothetical protein
MINSMLQVQHGIVVCHAWSASAFSPRSHSALDLTGQSAGCSEIESYFVTRCLLVTGSDFFQGVRVHETGGGKRSGVARRLIR